MFFGKHVHTIDEKNRIRIPKEYRTELGMEIVIGQGANKCLYIFSRKTFDETFKDVFNVGFFDYKKQYAMGDFLSTYSSPEIDSQGRIILPKELKQYAGIVKNIVTRGSGDKIEIWSEEELAKKTPTAGSESVEILAEKD